MTVGGELRLVAPGHTWEYNNHITKFSISESVSI